MKVTFSLRRSQIESKKKPLRNAFIGVCLMLTSLPAVAEVERERVVIDVNRAVPDQKSLSDARQEALNEAKNEAVQKIVGVRVQSEAFSYTAESADHYEDGFSRVISTDAQGRVVDWEKKDETFSVEDGQAFLRASFELEVAKEEGERDPSFQASTELNQGFFVDQGAPEENEEIVLEAIVSQDSRVYLFGISNEGVDVLFPNAFVEKVAATKNDSFEIPPPEWRSRGLRLRPAVPDGEERAFEVLMLVATKKPVGLPEVAMRSAEGTAAKRMSMQQLQAWLANIPLDQRAISKASYEVVLDDR